MQFSPKRSEVNW